MRLQVYKQKKPEQLTKVAQAQKYLLNIPRLMYAIKAVVIGNSLIARSSPLVKPTINKPKKRRAKKRATKVLDEVFILTVN